MSNTTYGVNDALSNKLWSKRLDVEALKTTVFNDYIGTTTSSLGQEKTETKKAAGDKVTYALRMLASGDGVAEGQVLEGNEEALTTYSDSLTLGELRHAVKIRNEGTIDRQRVPYDLRSEAYAALTDWFSDRMDTVWFNQLAGYTAQSDARYFGFNTPTAPSTNRVIRAGAQANDQSLTNSNTFTLNLIDKARNKATTATPQLRPISGLGRDVDYVCFLHPDQILSLRADTATAGNWFDLQKARLTGGDIDKNSLFTGTVGIYNRTLLVESTRVPLGVNASTGAAISNTRRAIFCGAQAITLAFGKDNTQTKFKWTEKMFDYDHELGVAASCIFAMKKTRFNSEDYGTVVISTYAAPA